MATIMAPPRTPSPKVRIRAQSFDSPSSSRMTVTPIEESPCSKSTGAIMSLPRHDVIKAAERGAMRPVHVLLPLHTKMSDESILSDSSSASSSVASSPTDSEGNMDLCSDSPLPSPCEPRQRPHPLTFCQSISYDESPAAVEPSSPFLYQDTSYPMYSPWLVRVVLDLYDVRGLDWMSIAEPIQRIWGVRTSTAQVLDILSANGRVNNRRWWD
ncbi:Nn.00g008780.m01.CDS01 [Neocucurbitaria sp. VM-36]